MARVRSISPRFFTHDGLFEAEQSSGLPLRVAFAGLWCIADRQGRFEWRPKQIKLDVLPFDSCDMEAVMGRLAEHGFVRRYRAEGQELGVIPKFLMYQKPHPREAPSRLPAPPSDEGDSGNHEAKPVKESRGPTQGEPSARQGTVEPGGLSGPRTLKPSGSQAFEEGPRADPRLAALLARFPEPVSLVVSEFLAGTPANAVAWIQTLNGCLDGDGMPEGRPATPADIAQTCTDFPGIRNNPWTPAYFRRCVARTERDRSRSGSPPLAPANGTRRLPRISA